MKLSENSHYLSYMRNFASQRYEQAISELDNCINSLPDDSDPELISFLVQSKGKTYFELGDTEKAIESYEQSLKISNNSPINLLHYAVFLARFLKDYSATLKMTNRLADDLPHIKQVAFEEGGLSKEYFLANCHALKGYSYCMMGDYETAGIELRQLIEMKYVNVDNAITLCDELLKRGRMVEEAKSYIRIVLDELVQAGDDERYEGFVNYLRKLISG